jgi:hypothetical protein
MVRPCVARGFRRSVGYAVLHQCIRPQFGACAPGHHGYQRACVLISGPASSGPFGSPVFASAGKTVLHLVSSSRRPRQVTIVAAMSSLAPHRCSSFVRAMRRSFVPACACSRAPRAGAVKAGRRAWLTSGSAFPGHALTAPSTVPLLTQIGTPSHLSSHFRICAPC